MDSWERVQRYLINSQTQLALPVGLFAVYLHPVDDAVKRNVAVPRLTDIGMLESWLDPLRQAFAAQGRVPAIQWVEGYAPEFAESLRRFGFAESQRESLLICTSDTSRPVSLIPGLTFVEIIESSPLSDVRENLDVNEFGFDSDGAKAATDEQAGEFRAQLGSARAFTAKLSGTAAAAGMYTAIHERITELVGITTLEPFRGRGIAGALTAHMAQAALESGCDLVFLRTTNPVALRAYERVGFRPMGAMLTYMASGSGSNDSSE